MAQLKGGAKMNVLFRRNLGVIFDVCHIVTCKTAKRETWIQSCIRSGSEAADVQEIENILSTFEDLNPKMLLFGYRDRKKGCLTDILIKYVDENIGNWDVEGFIQYLSDVEKMKNFVSEYYFSQEETDQIFDLIANDETLPGDLKSLLYEFFIFPDRYMKVVISEINKIFASLQKHYSEKFEVLLHCQETFNYSILKQENSPFSKNKRWDQGVKNMYVSFSLVNKYTITRGRGSVDGWLLLGYDFFSTLGEMNETKLNIAAFGNAFGDKLRVKIVEEIVKNGEMTLADLSRKLGVVNTIAIYHLEILKKENLLLHRYQGRKVLYCLNVNQIEKGLAAIKSLCGGTEE